VYDSKSRHRKALFFPSPPLSTLGGDPKANDVAQGGPIFCSSPLFSLSGFGGGNSFLKSKKGSGKGKWSRIDLDGMGQRQTEGLTLGQPPLSPSSSFVRMSPALSFSHSFASCVWRLAWRT